MVREEHVYTMNMQGEGRKSLISTTSTLLGGGGGGGDG